MINSIKVSAENRENILLDNIVCTDLGSTVSMNIINYWLEFISEHFKRLFISFLKVENVNILCSRIYLFLGVLLVLFVNTCK